MTVIRHRSLASAAVATAVVVGLISAPSALAQPTEDSPSPTASPTEGDDPEPSPSETEDSGDDSGDDDSGDDDSGDEDSDDDSDAGGDDGSDDESPTPTPSDSSSDHPEDDPEDGQDQGSDGEPSDEDAAEEAYEAALQDAYTRAVAEANRLLTMTSTKLEQAEADLKDAKEKAEQARTESEQAQQEAEVAEAAAERTTRQIEATAERVSSARNTVGTVARQAYQGSDLNTWSVFLDSENPTEFTNRYVGMRALLEAGDTALGDLSVDEANLRNSEARLAAQMELNEQKVEEAERKLDNAEQAEAQAERAATDLEESNNRYAEALDSFDEARAEDQEMYEEILDESLELEEELSSGDYGSGEGTGEFVRPGNGSITSEFGQRFHPILRYTKLHTGTDFGVGDGRIRAADSGTVVKAEFNSAYGNMVVVDHGEIDGQQISTMYAHQSGLMIDPGQDVEKGQHIGQIGSTGYSTGPHLHFEVRANGEPVNPRSWL